MKTEYINTWEVVILVPGSWTHGKGSISECFNQKKKKERKKKSERMVPFSFKYKNQFSLNKQKGRRVL